MAVRVVNVDEVVNPAFIAPDVFRQLNIPDDAPLARYVSDRDPFKLAAPCWLVRVWFQLPPETVITVVKLTPEQEISKLMAIRTVEATKAPQRLFVRGGISSKQDYVDLLTALNTVKPDQALIVDMDAKAWIKADGTPIVKPEVVFANSLRRRFDSTGLAVTAYMSGNLQITVRRLTALEIKERAAGKGKRKK